MLTDGRVVGWRLFDCDGPVDFLSEVQNCFINISIFITVPGRKPFL